MKKYILILSLTLIIALAIYSIAQSAGDAEATQACCLNADGYCRDVLVKPGEDECGNHEGYSLLNTEFNCIMLERCCTYPDKTDCVEGKCIIRGKEQPDAKQYYVCQALCKEVGECKCSGGIETCVGDWQWIPNDRT